MALAIISEKYADGRSKTVRTTEPLSPALSKQAEELDKYLRNAVKQMEVSLINEGILDQAIPDAGSSKSRGSVALWHAVGMQLREIADRARVGGARERRWLWEAIDNLHSTERLRRARRGKTRLHFEYCYRLAAFPEPTAAKLNWSEWVYFFDSLTVREEPRADEWLRRVLDEDHTLSRVAFRRFTENLNRRIRKMDTSILTDAELSALYSEVWDATKPTEVGSK